MPQTISYFSCVTATASAWSIVALRLPAALDKGPFADWTFWPSGTCEPANVQFKGPEGTWEVNYEPLAGRPQIVRYAAR